MTLALALCLAAHSRLVKADGSCAGNVHQGHDQHGGKILAGIKPHFITAQDDAACCALCAGKEGERAPCMPHSWRVWVAVVVVVVYVVCMCVVPTGCTYG